MFQNRSQLPPPLHLDLHPRLAPDDPAVARGIVGRKVFALVGTPGQDPRTLPRLDLGAIRAEDVQHVELAIHASAGPAGAYVAYRLAYRLIVARGPLAPFADPFFVPAGYFFRYVVDADTGEVVEDAAPPVVPAGGEEP